MKMSKKTNWAVAG